MNIRISVSFTVSRKVRPVLKVRADQSENVVVAQRHNEGGSWLDLPGTLSLALIRAGDVELEPREEAFRGLHVLYIDFQRNGCGQRSVTATPLWLLVRVHFAEGSPFVR